MNRLDAIRACGNRLAQRIERNGARPDLLQRLERLTRARRKYGKASNAMND